MTTRNDIESQIFEAPTISNIEEINVVALPEVRIDAILVSQNTILGMNQFQYKFLKKIICTMLYLFSMVAVGSISIALYNTYLSR